MEAFTLYLFKSAIWLTGLAVIYFLFLRNERFSLLKRVYLVAGILISFIFPLISVHYKVDLPAPVNQVDFNTAYNISDIDVQKFSSDKTFAYRNVPLFLYLAGVLFLASRLILNLKSLYKKINKAEINNRDQVKLIRASEFSHPFSFFNYVFVNPSVNETEVEEIMNHELVHVRQKHWFDLLLVELLCLFQWVNPFAWIYTRFIRLNHEYIADEIALQRTSDPAVYRAALLNQMFGSPVISLSNSFNYSLNKKRFDMMKKILTSPYRKMKLLLVLPVIAVIFYAFATPDYHYAQSDNNTLTIYKAPAIAAKVVKGTVVNEEIKSLPLVTIVDSERSNGTMTDAKGYFEFANVPDEKTHNFSNAGYKLMELKPDFTSEMTVKLLKDTDYQIQLKRNTTLVSRSKPLIIVDGVISDMDLKNLSPNDISSISVYKGNSWAKKYGGKGEEGVISITTKKKAAESGGNYLLSSYQTPATVAKVIKGTVLNEIGAPLPNTNIIVSGTTIGTSSDSKGQFTLTNIPEESFLVFSYVGYKSLKFKPDFNNEIVVRMERVTIAIESDVITPAKKPIGNVNPVKATSPEKEIARKNEKIAVPEQKPEKEMFIMVEEMPSFPGGESAMRNFISRRIKYPEKVVRGKISGDVVVSFVVKSTGKINEVKVVKPLNPILDAEAIRVVKSMPDWNPGKQNGKPVDIDYVVRLTFNVK